MVSPLARQVERNTVSIEELRTLMEELARAHLLTEQALQRMEQNIEAMRREFRKEIIERERQLRAEMGSWKQEREERERQFRAQMESWRKEREEQERQFRAQMEAWRKEREEREQQFRAQMEAWRKEREEQEQQFRAQMESWRKEREEQERQFRAQMEAWRKDLNAEMEKWKREIWGEIRETNRRWGELANKMGTLTEDMVAPNIPRILRQVVGCGDEDILFFAARVRKRHAQRSEHMKEFDVVVVCDDFVLINETKSTLRPSDVDAFLRTLQHIREYFPEYADKKFIGAIATLYMPEEVAKYAERKGLIAVGFGEYTMDVLNSPGFKPKVF